MGISMFAAFRVPDAEFARMDRSAQAVRPVKKAKQGNKAKSVRREDPDKWDERDISVYFNKHDPSF